MLGRLIVVLAAVAALGVAATAETNNVGCEPALIDNAGMLTTSTRLDGAVEALRREGVDTIIRTIASGAPWDHATDLAARCPELGSRDTDAVIVVLGTAGAAELLAIGDTAPMDAATAEQTLQERIGAGDPDVTSAVAESLEQLWQARSSNDPFEAGPGSANVWAAARQWRVARTASAVGSVVAVAGIAGVALHRRRRQLAADIDEAQRRRAALAEAYLDLDIAVIRATRGSAAGALPAHHAAAVNAAAERAGAALLATADARPARASHARALAATYAAAEHDLRTAVSMIHGGGPDVPAVAPVGFGVQAHERTGAH